MTPFGMLDPAVVAAHELKSPLALVRQLTLELQTAQLDEVKRRQLTEQILLTSEKALRLSTNLTKSSQLQEELFPSEPINVVELCREIDYELGPMYRAYERRLRYRSNRLMPLAAANHELLRRIVAGFVDNALHYGDEQGVVELYTQLLREKDLVRIGVRDHGPKLSSSTLRQIKSGNVSMPSRQRPASSGLGLHIAHRFAEVIHGKIGAIRHHDGSSFYIDIPVSKQLSLL